MKILIVSTFFPPENSIASFRPYSWAKWWSKAGHKVTVLTTEKEVSSNDLHKDLSGFNIIELPLPHFFRKNRSVSNENHVIEQKVLQTIPENKNFIKRILLWYMKKTGCFNSRFPSLTDFWAINARKAVNPFDYDAVISTGGPYSVHFVADYLKKKNTELIWCVDWRDYWTLSAECHGSILFRWWEKLKDKSFLNHANFVTTVSDQFRDNFQFLTQTKVYTIYNGYDPDDFNIIEPYIRGNEKLLIVYAGTIYDAIQDPSPLFRAISELKREGKIVVGDVKVFFCGSCSQIISKVIKFDISEFVSYLGTLSHEQAVSLEKAADVVLFLGHEAPEARGVLTGKLYEYLYCTKEIWAIGISNKMQAGEFIERANAGKVLFTDIEKIKQAIIEKISNEDSVLTSKDMNFIKQFDRKILANNLLEIFNQIYIKR